MEAIFEAVVYHPFVTITVAWCTYLVVLGIHRVYFDPLHNFPGPKLAAATQIYEFYYDFIKGGQYTWRIREMHEKYGPIVRISPCEIHIADPDFYDSVYTGSSNPRDKWWFTARLFGVPTAFISAVEHDLHRARKGPLNHFFSKRSVTQLEPMIAAMVEKLCDRLSKFKSTGKPISMRNACAAFTMDVVTQYSFAKPYGALDEEDFAPHWPDAVDAIEELTYLNVYFPWAAELLRNLPLWLTRKLNPLMAKVVEFHLSMAEQISTIMNSESKDNHGYDHPTIFHEFLRTDGLPASNRNLQHFLGEAQTVVGAGQVTTTYHLQVTCWYILSTPHVLPKLKAELEEAIPDPTVLPSVQKLEQLPYLSAVADEGHRFTHGVAHRLPRVSPKNPIVYKNWIIPPGTPVSMTHMLTHQNPSIFADPFAFRPERWLGPDAASLRKYLTPFSKGTRSCLGLHLAQAEILLALAALFRKFDFEPYQTTQDDMDIVFDYFVPMPKRGSKGLQVLVK
ncbi:putative P450 monooxygenase [Lojkania enalia]|uniref:P450 monooxygenase n=1 Tax=Lojkania enalia TaxID=147567 RepID=A0A9P4NB26_9PLEO|nr:putative P450 monooxygenase [Didymosphaeria enalia]